MADSGFPIDAPVCPAPGAATRRAIERCLAGPACLGLRLAPPNAAGVGDVVAAVAECDNLARCLERYPGLLDSLVRELSPALTEKTYRDGVLPD